MSKSTVRKKKKKSKTNISRMKEWRHFELFVQRIEQALCPKGAIVKCPDNIADKVTGTLREVDASIRFKIGTADMLITVECRKRPKNQDCTWIEQLKTKKESIGSSKTIAVSSNGFSGEAMSLAKRSGIDLRIIKRVDENSINSWLECAQFSMQTGMANYTIGVDINEDEVSDFNLFMKNLESINTTILWPVAFIHSTYAKKMVSPMDIFEEVVMIYIHRFNLINLNKSKLFKIRIKIPQGLFHFTNQAKQYNVVELYVEFRFIEFSHNIIKDKNHFKYSDENEDLVNVMEFNYTNPDGEENLVSVHQEVKTGNSYFNYWPKGI